MGVSVRELLKIDALTCLLFFLYIALFISELELRRCEVGGTMRVSYDD